MAIGQQSLTRNLFGAGKGDRVRPREVSAEQERANYCNAFHQCYDCCKIKVATQYAVIRSGNQTVICETCYDKEV